MKVFNTLVVLSLLFLISLSANGIYDTISTSRKIPITGASADIESTIVMLNVVNDDRTEIEVPVATGGAGGGGSGGPPTRPKNISKRILLELFAPPSQSLFSGDGLDIIITLKNKGDLALYNISLDTLTNAPDVNLGLSNDFFDSLDVGNEDQLTLNIRSLTDPKAHIGINKYFVTINAHVPEHDYRTSIRFFIDLVEKDYETRLETLKELQFAENLVREKINCSKFEYMVIEAKGYYDDSDYIRARSLIDSTIQACRDVIDPLEWEEEFEELRKTGMAFIFGQFGIDYPKEGNVLLLIIIMLLLLGALSTIFYYSRKRRGITKRKRLHDKLQTKLESTFEDLADETSQLIKRKDIIGARRKYIELSALYKTVKDSLLPVSIKTSYYLELSTLYKELSKLIDKHRK